MYFILQNDFVALKRLRKDNLSLSRDMLIEMKQVILTSGFFKYNMRTSLNPIQLINRTIQ